MSPNALKIEKDIQRLTFDEQVSLLTRLVERLGKSKPEIPARVEFSSEAVLEEKVLAGLDSPKSSMTDTDWTALDDRITRKTTSSA